METWKQSPDSSNKPPFNIVLRPVGFVKNSVKEPILVADDDGISMQGQTDTSQENIRKTHENISEIIINEDLADILYGIEKYSHLVVLYWAHKVPEKSRSLTRVHPMGRKEFPLTGIFSTCSPARPNPVLMTVVRLLSRKGNVLEVAGLDAVDGSPVIDIKPYVKESYPLEDVLTPDWMQRIQKEVRERKK
ncbi:tRNA (N6-threonylcarbamoyladenosine(37)-N6)-methyltransferase TrmO [Methanocella sp. CWC-04]|uniref:tRNA (N6-threonylcarbamoyladenosine(37)-N6)-methyltransferase TrmO n=1 Tax=Methanooceanicella nereidis TaxID=2052831 RepID=A0AAP2W7U5_9EURY|nr:tRNA (N6-threonylcarbamoyladenosine(37)-N6)-methyltransferase TrmO [Methanocella sp. CWC-04]MCD1295421.1 tRNA (N6-threonylcarbamoyladenosine(37)-N6)-methyltransferase TrmO [Methanocella sp. CWC-04]